MKKERLVILINPVSLHDELCQVLHQANIKLIALYTLQSELPDYLKIHFDSFVTTETLSHELEQDVMRIKELAKGYHLITVLPAHELDLAYAEQLSYAVCPETSNDPHDSILRYRKYEMNEAQGRAGLPYIPQMRFHVNDDISDIGKLHYPVVVKPSFQASCSIGVKACNNWKAVNNHLKALKQSADILGQPLESNIVIQEKIIGTEYFADSVSWAGKHVITSIFKYDKAEINGSLIYRIIEFVQPSDRIWPFCYDFIQKTLTALKVQYGFSHTEFMLTKDNTPYLMELNPRLSGLGGQANKLCQLITNYDQASLYLQIIQDSAINKLDIQKQYPQQKKHGRIIFIFSWKECLFNSFNKAVLNQLHSEQALYREFKAAGAQLTPPHDLTDVVATIILVDQSLDKIITDTNTLQNLEQQGKLF